MIQLPEQKLSPTTLKRFQTMARAFEQICAGASPWIPLGKFMHQYFGEFKAYREELVRDPVVLPAKPTFEQLRWAVFCAASVEYLCEKYEHPCPEWANSWGYSLIEPWYHSPGADQEWVQQELRTTAPQAFARYNIFCGPNVYNNKYEKRRRTS